MQELVGGIKLFVTNVAIEQSVNRYSYRFTCCDGPSKIGICAVAWRRAKVQTVKPLRKLYTEGSRS